MRKLWTILYVCCLLMGAANLIFLLTACWFWLTDRAPGYMVLQGVAYLFQMVAAGYYCRLRVREAPAAPAAPAAPDPYLDAARRELDGERWSDDALLKELNRLEGRVHEREAALLRKWGRYGGYEVREEIIIDGKYDVIHYLAKVPPENAEFIIDYLEDTSYYFIRRPTSSTEPR